MTAAALALALAVLVAPAPSRRPSPRATARMSRIPFAPLVVAGVCLAVVTLPSGVAVAVGVAASTWWRRRGRAHRGRRRTAETASLGAALEIMAAELRAGAHPVTAIDAAAGEVHAGVAEALHVVAARARLGADVSAGLRDVADQSACPQAWQRLAVTWQLAEARGVTIAALVSAAHRDIVERQRFSSRVTAALAGARTTALILAGLPLLGIALGQLIGAEPVQFLLSDGFGGWCLAVGVALACCGLLWSDRIVDGVAS